jgi:hypothetical protein
MNLVCQPCLKEPAFAGLRRLRTVASGAMFTPNGGRVSYRWYRLVIDTSIHIIFL